MAVRLSPTWWAVADDRLLEFLESEGPHSPTRIHEDGRLEFSRQHLNNRLLMLANAGFVESDVIGRGIYDITDQGESYLSGEFDARDLDKPET